MTDDPATELTGENRCWPCTVANSAVALVVAMVPVVAAVVRGDATVLALAVVWAVAVIGYSCYRLLARGYLPYSETIARRTGLHERIGPGREDEERD